jgi:hypothetical protein
VNTHSKRNVLLVRRNLRHARSRWGRNLGVALERALAVWSEELRISIERGEQRDSEAARAQNENADFAPRYFSAACRDLHRAIDHYMELKKNNL